MCESRGHTAFAVDLHSSAVPMDEGRPPARNDVASAECAFFVHLGSIGPLRGGGLLGPFRLGNMLSWSHATKGRPAGVFGEW
jgi:hypothetical protein